MIKVARKPSSDPAQEKLRQNKSLWNKEVSTFINDLINFKKTMNGAPSKFHPEKGTIKEPIPADPATIIGVLANDFDEIAQKGNQIITQQIEYSKTRKKSKPKVEQPISSVPEASTPNLSQQLLAASTEFQLIAEGSNPITRFFTRLFNPTIGFGDAADLRRARISMLNACADAHYKLEKFQVLVVKSSKESIVAAHKKLEDASHDWNLVSRAYNIYKTSKAASAPDKGGGIESQRKIDKEDQKAIRQIDNSLDNLTQEPVLVEPAPTPDLSSLLVLEKVKNMASDYRKYHEFIPSDSDGGGYLSELDAATDKFIASRGKKIHPDFESFYQQALVNLNKELGTTGNSFKDIAAQLQNKAKQQAKVENIDPTKTAAYAIEKAAQDFLKRWIGKTKHHFSIFDNTSPFRLNCYREAKVLKDKIDQVMNILEKGLDQEQLDPLIKSINGDFVSLRGLMSSLYLSGRIRK